MQKSILPGAIWEMPELQAQDNHDYSLRPKGGKIQNACDDFRLTEGGVTMLEIIEAIKSNGAFYCFLGIAFGLSFGVPLILAVKKKGDK